MLIQPEKPSMDEAEKELIGAGYCRLSDTDKKVIAGEVEALIFAQEIREKEKDPIK